MGDWEITGPYGSTPDSGVLTEEDLAVTGRDWDGWISDGRGTWTSPEGYGAGGSGIAYILSPTGFSMTDGLIDTASVTSPYVAASPDLGGWSAVDPDGNPETTNLAALGDVGYRGEGMRGANALRDSETDEVVGEREFAVKFEEQPEDLQIETSTMGLGYVEMGTTTEEGYKIEKLFFNYSKISSEPTYAITKDNVDWSDPHRRTFYKANPFYYSEDESAGLQFKFGWNPIYADESGLTGQLSGIFHASMNRVISMLNATYPTSYATFPRTPPLRLSPKLISAIPGTELEEAAPTGIAAQRQVPSALPPGGNLEVSLDPAAMTSFSSADTSGDY